VKSEKELFLDYDEYSNVNIIKIVGNKFCNFMLLKNGNLLTWGGFNSLKQIGRTVELHMLEQILPKIINLPKQNLKIIDIVLGTEHCIAKTIDNRIISWGENDKGQVKILIMYIKAWYRKNR